MFVHRERASRRGHPRVSEAGESDRDGSDASVDRPGRERSDARSLDGTVEALVPSAEALVVATVAGAVDIEQGDHQSRALIVASDATRCLDVLGRCLRLAQDNHQAQALDVQTDRDHVRGKGHVHVLFLDVRQSQAPLCVGHFVGADPTREFTRLCQAGSIDE